MPTATLAEHRPRRTDSALQRIDTHEKVCSERWGTILKRMDRIETIVIGAAGLLITGMGGLLVAILTKGAH